MLTFSYNTHVFVTRILVGCNKVKVEGGGSYSLCSGDEGLHAIQRLLDIGSYIYIFIVTNTWNTCIYLLI